MANIKIDAFEYTTWAESMWSEFASESISDGRYVSRLKFSVNMAGQFRVTLGGLSNVLYKGESFDDAVSAYHAVEGK